MSTENISISRRDFIRTTSGLILLSAAASSPLKLLARNPVKKITILHTNDWHSRIEPFPAGSGQYQGMGGAAVRAALIKKIRKEEKNVLLLDAGDIFQGTPYFNFFDGELEYRLMSQMGYDCATLGNHDFDNGIEGIINQLRLATFSFVNCNYDFSNTLLNGKVMPYRIFNRDGIRIGITGVGIELKDLVPDELFGNIIYKDPVEAANRIASTLKTKHKCDLVICLSHLGYKYSNDKVSDIVLAQRSKDIDLVIGGHTHTFLPKPHIEKNTIGNDVMINQVGWAGLNLGRIDFFFEPFKSKASTITSEIVEVKDPTL